MKYIATFTRQTFPWSEPWNTTRDIEASSKKEAEAVAEQIATDNTHEFDCQGGGRSFVGKMVLVSVR